MESATDRHPCSANSATRPQKPSKQVTDVPHKSKQEDKNAMRKASNNHPLPSADRNTAPSRNGTRSTGKTVPWRNETKGLQNQQAVLAVKKSKKMAATSTESSVREQNPSPSLASTQHVHTGHVTGVQGGDQGELYDGSTSLSDVIEEVVIQGPELEETTLSQTSEEHQSEVGGADDCAKWERTHEKLAQRAEELVSKMLGQPVVGASERAGVGTMCGGVRGWEEAREKESNGQLQEHEKARTEREKGLKKAVTFQMASPHKMTAGSSTMQVASPEQLEGKVGRLTTSSSCRNAELAHWAYCCVYT